MAVHQPSIVVAQMHSPTLAVAPHLAVGTLVMARPLPMAELFEAVLPNIPKAIPIDIALMEVGPDRRTARNGAIHPDRGDRNAGSTLIEMVAHLSFVTSQKSFAGVADLDTSLLARAADELQHLAELAVGQGQRLILLGTASRENREDAPMADTLGDQKLLELFEAIDHRRGDTGNHVIGQSRRTDNHTEGIKCLFETAGVAADIVVRILEAVKTDRDGTKTGIDKAFESSRIECKAVGHHSPRVSPAGNLAARLLQIAAHKHLSARKDYQDLAGAGMGCHLLVEYLQKVRKGHIRNPGIDPAVAAAMAAGQITTQRTLPKEGVQFMSLDLTPCERQRVLWDNAADFFGIE